MTRRRRWRTVGLLGPVALLAATWSLGSGLTPAAAAAGRAAAARATGDWGFDPLVIRVRLPARPLTTALRIECFSRSGCTGDSAFTFGPRDSNGHTIHFTGTSATAEPMVDSAGARVGTCRSDPAPFGDITCRADRAFSVPDGGVVGTVDTITYTRFGRTGAGQPLAGDSWSDSPTGENAGNDPDNDEQLIVTVPAPNPLEVYMDPTAPGFAAGQAAQFEQVGLICESEAFCDAPRGAALEATVGPAGVFFPVPPGASRRLEGTDVSFSCDFGRSRGYSGRGSDEVTCALEAATVVDHYGGGVLELPIAATAGAYPQHADYRLTVEPGHEARGAGVYTDLTVDAPVRFTTTSLPAGSVGVAYRARLRAVGGVPAGGGLGPPVLTHHFHVAVHALPEGLHLAGGVIRGTPVAAGRVTVSIEATDSEGDEVTRAFSIEIAGH